MQELAKHLLPSSTNLGTAGHFDATILMTKKYLGRWGFRYSDHSHCGAALRNVQQVLVENRGPLDRR